MFETFVDVAVLICELGSFDIHFARLTLQGLREGSDCKARIGQSVLVVVQRLGHFPSDCVILQRFEPLSYNFVVGSNI